MIFCFLLFNIYIPQNLGIQPADKEADVLYDVMFDEPFQGGLTRAGELSTHRCYILHWGAFINISHGGRMGGTNTVRVYGQNPMMVNMNDLIFIINFKHVKVLSGY